MIRHHSKVASDTELSALLHPYVSRFFLETFGSFSPPQKLGIAPIHHKENTLIFAPTGTGKTLTAFASVLNELVLLSEKGELADTMHCVYISPLKALSRDIRLNLLDPLAQIKKSAAADGRDINIRVAVRTGDTSSSKKSQMLKRPPHILITTPESLAIVLTSPKFREYLRTVKWVIVDEIHALAGSKRGVDLSLSMERLALLADFTRIGLSATVSPVDTVARFLVGIADPDVGIERDCTVIDAQFIKKLDIKVLSPVENIVRTPHQVAHNTMYELIDKLVQDHKTTLIFTNTRSATERVVHTLKEKFPSHYSEKQGEGSSKSLIGAHHGSLSAAHRVNIENLLKSGQLKCIVSSTSLELGIDIGYIDLVILLGSPKSVARALQRIGRSGHRLADTAKGRIIVLDRDDLVECSVLLKAAMEKKIDNISIPENCLDVLSQQIYGMSIEDMRNIEDLYRCIRRSYCYRDLPREDFESVISYLSGSYASLEDRRVYAKIWYDKETGMIGRKGRMARVLYMTNVGTIPDETHALVKLNNEVIGKIDEEFLERLKRGDVFVLGGDTYEFLYAKGMVAYVKTSSGRPPTVPSWFSEMLPLSFELALEIQRFRRMMSQYLSGGSTRDEILKFINSYLYVDSFGANSIYEYFREQHLYAQIPHDRRLIIEHFSEESRKHVVFHALYGRRVNDVLSRALAYAIAKVQHRDVEITIGDNGFMLSYSGSVQVMKAFSLIRSRDLQKIMDIALDKTEIMRRRFRHCAARSFMILRKYLGREKSVGRQQVSSQLIYSAAKSLPGDFPIIKEARREILRDLMDIGNAKKVLSEIEDKKIELLEIYKDYPSPFCFGLVMEGYSDIFKIEDKAAFLMRMHDKILSKIENKPGEEKLRFSYQDIWERSQEDKRQMKVDTAERLKAELASTSLPRNLKEPVFRMIDGETDIEPDLVKELASRKDEISHFGGELQPFLLKKLSDLDERTILLKQLNHAYYRVRFDDDILYDFKRLIGGDRKGFSQKFKSYLDGLLSGVVPYVWEKEIVRFLAGAKKELE